MYLAGTGLVFVVSVALMLSIDPVLTVAALACLPLVSVAVKFFGSAVYRQTERIQAQLSTLSAVVQEGLAGVRVVRAYCREGVESERFGRENREYYARNARLIRIQALFYPSLGFILGLAGVLVLWLGARHVIEGRITVGQFVAFNAYLLMLSWPIDRVRVRDQPVPAGDGGVGPHVRRPRRAPGRGRAAGRRGVASVVGNRGGRGCRRMRRQCRRRPPRRRR